MLPSLTSEDKWKDTILIPKVSKVNSELFFTSEQHMGKFDV